MSTAPHKLRQWTIPAKWMAGLPVAIFLTGLAASAALWATLAAQQRATARAALEFRTKAVTEALSTSLNSLTSVLIRAGGWWKELDGMPEQAWRNDALAIQRDFPALTGMQWVDRDFHVRWDTALPGGIAAAAEAAGLPEIEHAGAQRARAENQPALTLLAGGSDVGPRVDVLIPLSDKQGFDGWMRATLDLRRLVEQVRTDLSITSRLQLYSADDLILEAGNSPVAHPYAAAATLAYMGLELRSVLLPGTAFSAETGSSVPETMFAAAAAASLILAALARQLILLVDRTRALRTSRETLSAYQAHIDTVYRVAPVGLCLLDTDMRYLQVNERMAGVYGKSPEDLTGRRPREVDAVRGERFEPFLTYVLNMGTALENVEVLLDPKPGPSDSMEEGEDTRAWLCSFHPAYDASGRISGIVGAVLDISSLKDAEAEKRELAAQLFLSQKTEALGRLTGGIAHDFNNMLGVILGSLEFLRDLPGDSQYKTLLDRVELAAEHSADLVRRLLAFARQQPLTPRVVHLGASVENLVPLFQKSIDQNVEIRTVVAPDSWTAKVDESQFGSALLNLIINARDAMPNGGKITIEVANAVLDEDYASGELEVQPGEYVSVVVSDTGAGMSRETLARAFEPFFTTKETGRGSGLGLSMVFGFVKQSHGHISIYSEPGHGTAVKLYFPRGADDLPVLNKTATEILRGNENILVVEDDPLIRETTVRQLSSLGYRVSAAAGGHEALDILKERGDFDLLFTDVVMPGGIDGLGLAKSALALHPGLKVLFVSGFTDSALAADWLAAGAKLLRKPYRRPELAAKVHEVLAAAAIDAP